MSHPPGSHRPVPRRTSSSFLSAFSSTAGSSSSSAASIPALPPPPPPSAFYPATSPAYSSVAGGREGSLGRSAGFGHDDGGGGDGSSVFSDLTHSTTLVGGSGSAPDRSYAGSVASGIAGGSNGGVTWTTRAVLIDMLSKRLGTWDALRRAHQGCLPAGRCRRPSVVQRLTFACAALASASTTLTTTTAGRFTGATRSICQSRPSKPASIQQSFARDRMPSRCLACRSPQCSRSGAWPTSSSSRTGRSTSLTPPRLADRPSAAARAGR